MIISRTKIQLTTLMLLTIIFSGCIAKGKIDVTLKDSSKNKQLGILNLNIASVKIENDQLIVDGANLSGITQVKFVKDGVTQTLAVESTSASQLVANGITTVTFNVGQVFDMILSTANAAATVPVLFNLNNKTVTATMLANMGALSGQVLKFNGTDWAPASLIDAQLYKGTWDPATILPDAGLSSPGDYWVVSVAGTNAGNGITYAVGDWIISDGYTWSKLALSKTSVTSFNGRKGLVNLIPGDYPNLKSGAKIPGSSLNDLANVDITTVAPINGDVLKFNGTNWVAGSGGGGGAGSVGSTEITDLSITGGDIAENTINPSKIYSSSIDAALYLRGDKTWANFAADVLNVPLSTYALDATTKPTVLVTDKIGPALGKIQKFLNDLDTDYMSKTALTQTVTGTFSFTSPTSFLYTQLPTGTNPNEAANVQYVQNYVTSAISSGGAYAPGTLTTASAATSGDTTLTVTSTTGYPPAGTLLVGNEAIIYTGKTATTFTGLTRGAFGTTAASITGGATVNNYVLTAKSTETVTPKMVVTGSGNVGIGIATPSSPLYVYSTVSQPIATFGHSSANRTEITNGGSILHTYSTGTDSRFHLSSNPRLDRGLTAGAHPGDNDLGGLFLGRSGTFAAITSTDVNQTGKRALSFWTGNDFTASKMYISDSGNVGIGTAAPTKRLTVVGGDALINSITVGLGGGSLATNLAVGEGALQANTTGATNTAIGAWALQGVTSGNNNTGVGFNALYASNGSGNTAVGASAGEQSTAGDGNSFFGQYSGYSSTGSKSSFYGFAAGLNATGDKNTLVGYRAGRDITTGAGNIYLGTITTTGNGVTTGSNNIQIGNDLTYGLNQSGSNQLNVGNLIFATGLSSGSTLSTGNVGIGTSAPRSALEVNGTISSNQIISESTLSASILSTDTSLTLASAANYPPTGTLFLSGGSPEIVSYTGISTNTLTGLTRGLYGTTAQGHSSGKTARILRVFLPGANGAQPSGFMVTSNNAIALGTPEGDYNPGGSSITSGHNSRASGSYAVAHGGAARASGSSSFAMGVDVSSNGSTSQAFGEGVTADSISQMSLGRYNQAKGGESAGSWVLTDPLFVVGNGVNSGARSNAMMILKNGNVGIGTNDPSQLLHVGSASVATGLAVANFQNIDGTCTITPASSGSGIACSSDERLKENFQDVLGSFALDRILKLQAVTYNFKTSSDENRRTGYRAQEVQKVAPEFVRENEDGLLQVYYDAFIPWITEAIKTLYNELRGIKEENTILSRQVAGLESHKADKNEIEKLKNENKKLKIEAEKQKEQNILMQARLEKIEKMLKLK